MNPKEIEKIMKQIWGQKSKNKHEVFYPQKYNSDKKLRLQIQTITKENK